MKKIIFIFCLMCGFIRMGFSQSTWFKVYGGAFADIAWSVIITRDNNILVIEERLRSIGSLNIPQTYLTKFDNFGNILWQKGIRDSLHSSFTWSASEDNFGNLFLPFFDSLYKLNPNGNVLWIKPFPDSLRIPRYACKFTNDYRNLILTGDANYRINLTKLDSSGNVKWTKILYSNDTTPLTYRTNYNGLQITNDAYYIAGNTNYGDAARAFIIKTDTSGNILWRLNNFTSTVLTLISIVQISNNTFIACGKYLGSLGNYRPYYMKFDATGNIIWQRGYDTIFISGQLIKTYNNKIAIIKGGGGWSYNGFAILDTMGNLLSEIRHYYHPDDDIAYFSIQQTTDSGFVIGGSYRPYDYRDSYSGGYCLVVKTDKNGNTEPLGINPISNGIPKFYSLSQNYPNPFNSTTKIRFVLPKNSITKLIVYDILGREVETLVGEQLNAGTYAVEWDASDYPSGIYYYKLSAGDYTETKKMILIK